MPASCSAYGCTNRRTVEKRGEGITFHRYPTDADLRNKWVVAVKRKGFSAKAECVLCSDHFKPEDFDRTGQTIRLRSGVIPSIFNFPAHLQIPAATTRTTAVSRRALESLSALDLVQDAARPESKPQPAVRLVSQDHTYALPSCPVALKERLLKATDNAIRLEQERNSARKRELRAKSHVKAVIEELNRLEREKNNAMKRELRTKSHLKDVIKELNRLVRGKNNAMKRELRAKSHMKDVIELREKT